MVTDLLQNEHRRRKLLGGSEGMLRREICSILITFCALSWLFESVRQYICQFHSPRMMPCKSANFLVKVNVHVVMNVQQGKSCQSRL